MIKTIPLISKTKDSPFYTPFRRVSRKNSMAGGAAKPCLFCDDILSTGAGFVKKLEIYRKRGQAHDSSPTATDKPQIHRPQRCPMAGPPLRRHLLQWPRIHRSPQARRRRIHHVRTKHCGSEGIRNAHPRFTAHRLLHNRQHRFRHKPHNGRFIWPAEHRNRHRLP